MNNKIVGSFFIILIIIAIYLGYLNFVKKSDSKKNNNLSLEQNSFTSSTIRDVNYISKDSKGNEYIINALTGEIDIDNSNIIYLTNVKAEINLKDSNKVVITSDFGKYNIANYDTIFSKKVFVKYLDNTINSEYLDFSMDRDSMIITNNVVYKNINNILKADVVEMDLTTKNLKIYMHSNKKKVNVKNIN